MALYINCDNPAALYKKFKDAIKQTEKKGKIETWIYDENELHITHTSDRWARLAWFKPVVDTGRIRFNIIKTQASIVSVPVYAYYHGHLAETFLNHFDEEFSASSATALASNGDYVRDQS